MEVIMETGTTIITITTITMAEEEVPMPILVTETDTAAQDTTMQMVEEEVILTVQEILPEILISIVIQEHHLAQEMPIILQREQILTTHHTIKRNNPQETFSQHLHVLTLQVLAEHVLLVEEAMAEEVAVEEVDPLVAVEEEDRN